MRRKKQTVVERVTLKKGKRKVTLLLGLCKCGSPAQTSCKGPFTIISCIKCGQELKVMGRERAFRCWNKRQQAVLKQELPNSSGAVSSAFGEGKTEAEKDFKKESKPAPKTADQLDRVDDRKVELPALVEVIDAKYGNTIGFRPQKEVFDLVQSDERFRGNVAEDGSYQLFYNPNWAKGNFIEVNCTSIEQYIACIKKGRDVISCDDPIRRLFQVSYLLNGSKYVATLPLASVRESLGLMSPALTKAILAGHTQGIIDWLAKQKTGEENEPR